MVKGFNDQYVHYIMNYFTLHYEFFRYIGKKSRENKNYLYFGRNKSDFTACVQIDA